MNTNKSASLLGTALACLFITPIVQANTLVFWNTNDQAKVVARTMDLKENESPVLRVTPRGVSRIGDLSQNHLSWQSQYSSVVVTAYNTNAATDGLNDQGLCAHMITMPRVDYGIRDASKPALSNALWVQYILDNYKTVEEAIASLEQYQLIHTTVGEKEVHAELALQDANGDSALIEFIDGNPKIYHGKEFNVITNQFSPDIQLKDLSLYKAFGGELPAPGEFDANSRFVRAASNLKALPAPQNASEAVAAVDGVIRTTMVPYGHEASPTQWVSIADLNNGVYYFNSTMTPGALWVNLKKLNLKESSPVLTLDPKQAGMNGDVTKLFKPEKKG